MEEKRQLIKLVLSNVRIEAKNVLYTVQSPFDLILKSVRIVNYFLRPAFRLP